jgi:hypothetical protein
MEPIHHKFTDLLMTKRLQTLQSVDVAVERIYQVSYTNIYLIYDSHDNTFLTGTESPWRA